MQIEYRKKKRCPVLQSSGIGTHIELTYRKFLDFKRVQCCRTHDHLEPLSIIAHCRYQFMNFMYQGLVSRRQQTILQTAIQALSSKHTCNRKIAYIASTTFNESRTQCYRHTIIKTKHERLSSARGCSKRRV